VPGAAQAAIIPTVDHVVWDRRFDDLVDGASLRQVGDGFGFPEGPVMLPDGYLVFSDIANDALVRFTRPGRTGIFRQPSGGANGNTLDPRGRLVTCEAGRRRVTRTEPDGAITVLAAHHEGKRLNAPNDVVIRSDGVVYFTDPIFLGPDEGLLAPSYMALGFCGVFRIALDGAVTPLTTELARPNGLAFSPDESRLYVVDSANNSVSAFDVTPDGTLRNHRQWTVMPHAAEGVGDGMKVDMDGHGYVTGPGGVWVVAPDGTPLGILRLPVAATNVAFYGYDAKILFVTAPPALFVVRLARPGISVLDRIR
jgi:gluconolactonase